MRTRRAFLSERVPSGHRAASHRRPRRNDRAAVLSRIVLGMARRPRIGARNARPPPTSSTPAAAAPEWLSRVVARWPAVAAALARCWKWARTLWRAKWPISLAGAALALLLFAGIWVTAASVQRGRDVAISQSFSTSAGVAAMKLAAANPDLARTLAKCPIASDGAHHVMDCRLWPIGSSALYRRGPAWYSMALGIVFDWVSSWPVESLTAALVFPWVIIAVLGFAKRGPASRLIWHPRWRR
jgi:hypothetical protein